MDLKTVKNRTSKLIEDAWFYLVSGILRIEFNVNVALVLIAWIAEVFFKNYNGTISIMVLIFFRVIALEIKIDSLRKELKREE